MMLRQQMDDGVVHWGRKHKIRLEVILRHLVGHAVLEMQVECLQLYLCTQSSCF